MNNNKNLIIVTLLIVYKKIKCENFDNTNEKSL